MWEYYKNLNGNSSVRKYMILQDEIIVEFSDGKQYFYKKNDVGILNFNSMVSCAKAGRGLGSLINSTPEIRNGYYKHT